MAPSRCQAPARAATKPALAGSVPRTGRRACAGCRAARVGAKAAGAALTAPMARRWRARHCCVRATGRTAACATSTSPTALTSTSSTRTCSSTVASCPSACGVSARPARTARRPRSTASRSRARKSATRPTLRSAHRTNGASARRRGGHGGTESLTHGGAASACAHGRMDAGGGGACGNQANLELAPVRHQRGLCRRRLPLQGRLCRRRLHVHTCVASCAAPARWRCVGLTAWRGAKAAGPAATPARLTTPNTGRM